MSVKEITICVDTESAEIYESAVSSDRQKIDVILSLRLKKLSREKRALEEVMHEISQKAQARGLTPEILSSLLED